MEQRNLHGYSSFEIPFSTQDKILDSEINRLVSERKVAMSVTVSDSIVKSWAVIQKCTQVKSTPWHSVHADEDKVSVKLMLPESFSPFFWELQVLARKGSLDEDLQLWTITNGKHRIVLWVDVISVEAAFHVALYPELSNAVYKV
jgi:hypothetical protein